MDAIRTPIAQAGFVDAGESFLFAWHHPACARTRRHAGVVLCPPLGYEYASAYRTWRMLAERLAKLGFDVLRLDYEGTGNSGDGAVAPPFAHVDKYVRNIHQAVRELRALAAPEAMALVGLRMGALLALKAAAGRDDIERLALWGAFPSGRACVRELRALARLSHQDHAHEDSEESDLNAAGYVLPHATLDSLSRWTASEMKTAPARDALLIDRSDRPVDPALANHLAGLGVRITTAQRQGTTEMLAPPHRSRVPESILSTLVGWFDNWRPVQTSSPASRPSGRTLRITQESGSYYERPVRFGPDQRLFGMLTGPALDANMPAIVLLTTGVEHHVGPHRLYVPLAREWAAGGHTVLRYDVGGVGDSVAPPGGLENAAYPPHLLDDAAEAIAFLRRTAPDRPVILAGLCSGGWAAFRAAREQLDVDGIVAVNLPLYLRDRDAGAAWRAEIEELEKYHQLRRRPVRWTSALRRPRSIEKGARLTVLALRRRVATWVGRTRSGRDGLAADLDHIGRRGLTTLFVFSAHDKGLEYFEMFGAAALRLAPAQQHIRYVVVDGAGHSFRPRRAQEALRELLIEFVNAQTVQAG